MDEMARLSSENRDLRVENDRLKALTSVTKPETTFALEVISPEGDLIPELIFTRVRPQALRYALDAYTPKELEQGAETDELGIEWSIGGARHKASSHFAQMTAFNEEIDEYLASEKSADRVRDYTVGQALLRCTRIAFAIRSIDGPTATDVRCEIEFPPDFTIRRGKLKEPQLPHDRPDRPSPDIASLAARAARMPFPPYLGLSVAMPSDVSVKGTLVSLRCKKVQHDNCVKFNDEDEIVTVLPAVDGPNEGKIRYRIWSDDTKRREGAIPFRIVLEPRLDHPTE